jgi:hypothetical protein
MTPLRYGNNSGHQTNSHGKANPPTDWKTAWITNLFRAGKDSVKINMLTGNTNKKPMGKTMRTNCCLRYQ